MTAIFGIWRFDGCDVDPDLRRMNKALARYGVDENQLWSNDSGQGLGRRFQHLLPEDRFSTIIEPQPRYVIAGDVRLTEREDLVSQLGLGDNALCLSDAAIASIAIESWHEQAFERIYGAFAIAAWDTREQRWLLARDHLGLKPLFYHCCDRFFAFSSMPGGLHALPDVPRAPDMASMKRFLALENLGPGRTHYEKIARVMPGHYAVFAADGMVDAPYWKPKLSPLFFDTHDAYARALTTYFDRAVAATLRGAETQVAAHLSSGFDSSAVASTAAIQLAARGGTVVAYTAAPREGYGATIPKRSADESLLASATVAMHPNMRHVVIRSDRTPLASLDRSASIFGLPVLNLCNNSWYDAINDHARKNGITIILEATLGNATISETGILALSELLKAGRIGAWIRLVAALRQKKSSSWLEILWISFRQWLPDWLYVRMLVWRYGAQSVGARWSALKDEHRNAAHAEVALERTWPFSSVRGPANAWMRENDRSIDDRLWFLEKDDSGASCKGTLGEWKIDYRDPTADRRLIEFSLRVPTQQLIHAGQPRSLLRKMLSGRVPTEVLDNRRKGYQAADWHEWINVARSEVINEIKRIESSETTSEIFDVDQLQVLVRNWPDPNSDVWRQQSSIVDYRYRLLRAISAASFIRKSSGSNH